MCKMWEPKNLNEAQLPMVIVAWMCGYGVIEHPLNKLGIIFSLIYLIFVGSLYSTCFYFAYLYFVHLDWPKHENKFISPIITFNCTIMIVNFIKGWSSKRTLVEVWERNKAVEKILEFVGAPVNLRRALKNSLLMVLSWIIFSTVSNMLLVIWFRQNLSLLKGFLVICILQHPAHINEIIDMNFMLAIRHIQLRLKSVNQILSNLNNIKHDDWIQKTNNISPYNFSFSARFSRRNKTGPDSASKSNDLVSNAENVLQIIKYLHLEIKVLSKKVMSIYDLSVITTMTTTFSMITYLFYSLYLSMWDPRIFHPDRTFKTFVIIMSIIGLFIKMITINYVCAQTVIEYRKTGEIVHQLNMQSSDLDIRNKIQQFCIQLMHHSLEFSPCGLIQLGFPFIRDFAGSLTTYLIILIQMNDTIPKLN